MDNKIRIINGNGDEISREDCDLSIGALQKRTIIRPGAEPPDGVTKIVYADDDYEEVLEYTVIPTTTRLEQRISALKSQLSATDYAVIKIAEGAATAEEYAGIIADREAWRAEINTLERQIKEANENE